MYLDYAQLIMFDLQVLLQAEPGFEPEFSHPGDAGADLRCTDDFELQPGQRRLVGTGVKIALPAGYVGLVHPRSGLASKHGISIVNAPGTIDAGYRGEILVNLINLSDQVFKVSRGDRIAQLLIQKFENPKFILVTELPGTDRGEAGIGSTGVR